MRKPLETATKEARRNDEIRRLTNAVEIYRENQATVTLPAAKAAIGRKIQRTLEKLEKLEREAI